MPVMTPKLEASLAKFQRRAQEAQQRLAVVPDQSKPEPVAAVSSSPLAAAAGSGAAPPGPQENPGEPALSLAWTQTRWGITRRLVSSRLGGAIYSITREDYDDGVAYHAWRDVKKMVVEIGSGFYSTSELAASEALVQAKAACLADALRRIGRE